MAPAGASYHQDQLCADRRGFLLYVQASCTAVLAARGGCVMRVNSGGRVTRAWRSSVSRLPPNMSFLHGLLNKAWRWTASNVHVLIRAVLMVKR